MDCDPGCAAMAGHVVFRFPGRAVGEVLSLPQHGVEAGGTQLHRLTAWLSAATEIRQRLMLAA